MPPKGVHLHPLNPPLVCVCVSRCVRVRAVWCVRVSVCVPCAVWCVRVSECVRAVWCVRVSECVRAVWCVRVSECVTVTETRAVICLICRS